MYPPHLRQEFNGMAAVLGTQGSVCTGSGMYTHCSAPVINTGMTTVDDNESARTTQVQRCITQHGWTFTSGEGRSAASPAKVGSVDLQRALNECAEGKAAKETFKRVVADFQSKLKPQKDQLDALKANGTDQPQLQAKMQEYKQDYEAAQNTLKSMDAALTENILKSLRETITRLAQRDHFTTIVEKSQRSNTEYGPPPVDNAVDVTDEVIHLHDEEGLQRRADPNAANAHN